MSTLTAPHNYRLAYVDGLHSSTPHSAYRHFHSAELCVIDNSDSWQLVGRILAGNDALAKNPRSDVQPIVRIELIWDKDTFGRQGALLFDNRGKLLLHVVHALFGYSGSGAAFGEYILSTLGVPPRMMLDASDAVGHDSYTLVFSREQIGVVEGVETALPYGNVGEWQWWLA